MNPIIKIAAQLAAEGKEPSTALVKARLQQPMPMIEIIRGLRSYKAAPKQYQQELETLMSAAPTKANLITEDTTLHSQTLTLTDLQKQVLQLQEETQTLRMQNIEIMRQLSELKQKIQS